MSVQDKHLAQSVAERDQAETGRVAEEPMAMIYRRRDMLQHMGLAAFGAAIGMTVPFANRAPNGLIPAAIAQTASEADIYARDTDGLTLLNDRPVNAETPPHLLDSQITPVERFFIRNNGITPDAALTQTAGDWSLTVDGEVDNALELSLDALKNDFEPVTMQLALECGGNGRAFFQPGASGNQWTFGAIGNAEFTGVRLADVLNAAGLKSSAFYTAHYGADAHLSGDPAKEPISRGVPIEKAMDEHNIIAFAMNGGELPAFHGYPLRLIIPGWPASFSHKWLTRIWIRDQIHDGAKMTGGSYRLPRYPVAPGTEVPDEDMVLMESMPVKSLITAPATGASVAAGPIEVRGSAWAGDSEVTALDVSIDFGATWQSADLDSPVNRYAWQRWSATVDLPQDGYYEIWARATDSEGRAQPPVVPGWNPRGYANNMMHRIAVFAA